LTDNITIVRRRNLQSLYQDFATQQLAAGESAKGLEQAFAAILQISPVRWSQIKTSLPISDKIARQLESNLGKESGWLDVPREFVGPDPGEERFIEAARAAWREANAKHKRELMRFIKSRPT
jgi:hypothetical protein